MTRTTYTAFSIAHVLTDDGVPVPLHVCPDDHGQAAVRGHPRRAEAAGHQDGVAAAHPRHHLHAGGHQSGVTIVSTNHSSPPPPTRAPGAPQSRTGATGRSILPTVIILFLIMCESTSNRSIDEQGISELLARMPS